MAQTYRARPRRGCGCIGCLNRLLLLALVLVVAVGLSSHYYHGGTTGELAAAVRSLPSRVAPWPETAPERLTEYARDGATLFSGLLDTVLGRSAPPDMPEATGAIQVFFAPVDEAREDGLDDVLVALVRGAEKQVDLACYELDLPDVAEALIDRHFAGVGVRLVTDSRYANREMIRHCVDEGLEVTFDRRQPYMHNKFCVVDGRWVWTGSANLTPNGMYRNNNNVLLIDAPPLAENYTAELEEMVAGEFGGRSPRNTVHPVVMVGDTEVECYFAPEDGVQAAIIEEIADANDTIHVLAFSFTSRPIAEALAGRIAAGVKVRALFEARNAGSAYSRDEYLAGQGAEILMDTNKYTMHHKVIVLDGDTVVTGSYNFSKSAETRNDENVLIVHSEAVARRFVDEFDRLVPESE